MGQWHEDLRHVLDGKHALERANEDRLTGQAQELLWDPGLHPGPRAAGGDDCHYVQPGRGGGLAYPLDVRRALGLCHLSTAFDQASPLGGSALGTLGRA